MRKKLAVILVIFLITLELAYHLLDPETKVLNEEERENLGGTYIRLTDGVTHYTLSGPDNAQLVVLVHGGTIPSWGLNTQVTALHKAGYRVLTYDMFGRGYSDRPATEYNQELYLRQLFELVERLNISRAFHLIGFSLGGATVVNFTAHYPEKVDKLVVVAPVIKDFEVAGVFNIPIIGELVARFVGVKIITNRFESLLKGNPDIIKYKQLFINQTEYKGFQQSLLSMIRGDALGDYTNAYKMLGKQYREILLIWGKEDAEVTAEMIDQVKSYLPKVQYNPVEMAGHGITFQNPQLVNKIMINFLQSNAATSTPGIEKTEE